MKDQIINTRISENLKLELDFISQELDKPVSVVVRMALDSFVEDYDENIEKEDKISGDDETYEIELISSKTFANLVWWFTSYRQNTENLGFQNLYYQTISSLKNSEIEAGSKQEFFHNIDSLSKGLHKFIDILSSNIKSQSLSKHHNESLDVNEFDILLNQLANCLRKVHVIYLDIP